MGELITKGELARRAHVSPSAVSKALARGTLKRALVGKKIDPEHAEVTAFLKRQLDNRRDKLLEKEGAVAPSPSKFNPSVPTEEEIMATRKLLTEDVRRLESMPFIDVIRTFGTEKNLIEFLKAINLIERISEQRVKNAESEGLLVSRELVQRGIIDRVNTAHTRLLTDGAKSISREIFTMVKAGKTEEDCEVFTRQQMTRFLKPMKDTVDRVIENTDKEE